MKLNCTVIAGAALTMGLRIHCCRVGLLSSGAVGLLEK